jgi:hypothetical protein
MFVVNPDCLKPQMSLILTEQSIQTCAESQVKSPKSQVMTLTFFKGPLENTFYSFFKFQNTIKLIFYTFDTLLGCYDPFLNQNKEKENFKQ